MNDDDETCDCEIFEFDEKAEMEHNIRMTDDPLYRDWYRKRQKEKEIEEFGIDED